MLTGHGGVGQSCPKYELSSRLDLALNNNRNINLSNFNMGMPQFFFVCIVVILGGLLVNGEIGKYCR